MTATDEIIFVLLSFAKNRVWNNGFKADIFFMIR